MVCRVTRHCDDNIDNHDELHDAPISESDTAVFKLIYIILL